MKILLILPRDNTYKYNGLFTKSISYAPLTLTTLASLIPPELNADVSIVDEGVQKSDYKNKTYDIVGITCTTSSSKRAYELSKYWKNKGSLVVLGGVHPTLLSEEALSHADVVIKGSGELSWPKFLRDYYNGNYQKIYDIKVNEFKGFPLPRRDLLKKNIYMNIPTIIANRGCSNICSFCSINKLWRNEKTKRPILEVVEEIKQLKSKNILFLDPSITSDKDYAKELFSKLIDLKIRWGGLSTISIVNDKEMMDLIKKSGCIGILNGFESLNQLNINENNKIFNDVSKYREAIDIFHKNQIAVLGCFVLGFDNDTEYSIKKSINIIDELNIDLPRFAVLTPFPGTETYEKFKKDNRILINDWSYYDTEHVVFQPKHMTKEILQNLLYDVWKKSYGYLKIFKRVSKMKNQVLIGLAASLGFRFYAQKLAKRRLVQIL